jgi:peptidylprolyl isomerase
MRHLAATLLLVMSGHAAADDTPAAPTMSSVLADSSPEEWVDIDPERMLVMQLETGRVVIELAPQFAPAHVTNILSLVKGRYFSDSRIVRSQDNYVVQWGDPKADTDDAKPLGDAKAKLPAEFDRSADGLSFTGLPDPDSYAAEVGVAEGFPAARGDGRAWLAHCYGMVGAGRGNPADSSNGSSLYVVTGHAPRHLDRNITLVGRVLEGMPLLASLPRGSGALGFFEDPAQQIPIKYIHLASQEPELRRPRLQKLRSDSASFRKLIEARRFRHEEWFVQPVGRLELCNMALPVR